MPEIKFLSLAYLVEISVVLNLAYAEYKREKVVLGMHAQIDSLLITIGEEIAQKQYVASTQGSQRTEIEILHELRVRIRDLRSAEAADRIAAWEYIDRKLARNGKLKLVGPLIGSFLFPPDTSKSWFKGFLAKIEYFRLFFKNREEDQVHSLMAMGYSLFTLFAVTLIDHFKIEDSIVYGYSVLSTLWLAFFVTLTICLIVPFRNMHRWRIVKGAIDKIATLSKVHYAKIVEDSATDNQKTLDAKLKG